MNDGDVEITMNSKNIEGLVEALELDQSYPKKLPCPADNGRAMQAKKGGMGRRSPHVQEGCRYTVVPSTREARSDVCAEETFDEASIAC